MITLTQRPAESWTHCSFQGHLGELQRRHEDVGEPILNHPLNLAAVGRQELEGYASAVGALLDHLAGKHADGCLVRLAGDQLPAVRHAFTEGA